MSLRFLTSRLALAAVVVVLLTTVSVLGQSNRSARDAASQTPWGHPDLQGVWHVSADVPLERPAEYAGREFLTDAEMAALDRKKAADPGLNARAEGARDVGGAYNAVFTSILKTGRRTSLIIDPRDGRLPALTPEAQKGQAGRGGSGGGEGRQLVDNPEDVENTRCLGVRSSFLPMNTAYAKGTVLRLVQSPGAVAIYLEDDHAGGGTRVIALDGSPHIVAKVRPYLGDSRGRWEGKTLVVETTNFQEQRTFNYWEERAFRGANASTFRMTERFTRVDANTLQREVTFEDPMTWTRPWTVLIEMGRSEEARNLIFESACHEGNYAITGILAGSRSQEKNGAR
jgi:hypothetical protein